MMTIDQLKPGMHVRVAQRIERRDGAWTAEIEGELLEIAEAPTGSWFAHGEDDRYWLKRIRLRKPNGEVSLLSLDPHSRVTVLAK